MADPVECPHGGDPNCCPPCQNVKHPEHRDVWTPQHSFTARFDGECGGCGYGIKRGGRLVQWSNPVKGYGLNLHDGCRPR